MPDAHLMKSHTVKIVDVYVPAARRKTLDLAKTEQIAEDIIEEGQKTPIQVRKDGNRYVLIEGLHRLEALKLLEQESVMTLFVQAKRR